MPTLSQSLNVHDLGLLHIIADLWGGELQAPDVRQGRENLHKLLLDPQLILEITESLSNQAQSGLAELIHHNGKIPWAQFVRRYGEVREFGLAKRDRKKPYFNPSSTSEILWYRALLGRAFYDTPEGPQEFAFIPIDFIPLMPNFSAEESSSLSRPAAPAERAHIIPASDNILDDACTLLAGLR
ncbi:MAG: hypothetical protein N2D54_07415, partial [Chloroflexota bacterium]